jgi:coenzyme F420 biosynthesis associated uncharacterized protein
VPPSRTPQTPQPLDLRRLGLLLLLGVAAGYGVRYVTSKKLATAPSEPRSLADWALARTIALNVSESAAHPVRDRAARQAQYQRLVEQSEPLIERYMGAPLAQPITRVYVFDRREWIEANFMAFKQLLEPVEEIYRDVEMPGALGMLLGAANREIIGAQMGLLVGYLARRVLGQYDLSLLSPDPQVRGALYFVEPNIAHTQSLLGANDEEFRLWIALHETSHVFEFEAFPWVRTHFQELLRQFLGQVSDQLGSFTDIAQLVQRVQRGRAQGQHWIEMMLTPDQKQVFDQLQALMSLVEGYSNHIMNVIGRELLPSFDLIEQRVHARQLNRPIIEEIFNRVTGMDLKLAQYRQGEQFVNAVVAQRGVAFVNLVWARPENLPTMEEIRSPQRWIARIDQSGAW